MLRGIIQGHANAKFSDECSWQIAGCQAVGRIGKGQLDKYYRVEGEEKLAAAKRALAAAKVPFETHILVGPVAESIVKHAKARRCDLIYMGNRGAGAIADAFIGSTASKVLQLSDTPVLLVK